MENTNFGKRTQPFQLRKISGISSLIEHGKCQGTIYKGSKRLLTAIVQIISLIINDLRGREKQTFQQSLSSRNKRSWPVLSRII